MTIISLFFLTNIYSALQAKSDVVTVSQFKHVYVSPRGNNTNSGLTPGEPLQSLEYAVNLITQSLGKGPLPEPVTIYLLDGIHYLQNPLKITAKTAYPLHFKSYQNAKPIISAGRRIDNWHESVVPWTGRKCLIADISAVKNGDWYFRQLFVNGKRASRPRLPKEGFYQVKELVRRDKGNILNASYRDRFVYKDGDIRNWHALTDINVMLLHYWQENYLILKELSPEENIVYFSNKSFMPLVHSHPSHGVADWIKFDKTRGCFVNNNYMPSVHSVGVHGLPQWLDFNQQLDAPNKTEHSWYFGAFYYVDNVAEALTLPGQWYLDRHEGRLYYIPLPGQNPDTIEVIAPVLTRQFIIESDWRNGHYIEDMKFEGISFMHTAYIWNTHYGTGNWPTFSGPGLIYAGGTRRLTIKNCTFENIGEYALDLIYGNSYTRIVGNTFRNIGSGAVKALGTWREKTQKENQNGKLHHLYMTDNEIAGYGRVFHGSNAINVQMAEQSVIAHNHIYDGYFTAINLGGGSTGGENLFAMFDTLVYKNLIHDIGQGMPCGNDLGAIYIHGNAIGCQLKGNHINNITCTVYGGNGIYVDDCSSYLTIAENLILGTTTECVNLKGRLTTIKNNIFGLSGRSIFRRASRHLYENELADINNNIFLINNGNVFCLTYGFTGKVTDPGFKLNKNIICNVTGQKLQVIMQQAYGRPDKTLAYDQWCNDSGQGQDDVLTDKILSDFQKSNYRITKDSFVSKHGFPSLDFSYTGVRPPDHRDKIPFLKSTRNGPQHQEAIKYAQKIMPQRDKKKKDWSTHTE